MFLPFLTLGTGKTYVLKEIINSLKGNVVVCAATGISGVILSEGLASHQVSTLHYTFGLMDGR